MQHSQEFGENIYRGVTKLINAGRALRRGVGAVINTGREVRTGFEIERAEAHPKPTNVEIADTLADLGYSACVYTSCSVYKGQEAAMVQAGRIRMIKTNIEHNSPGMAGGLSLGGEKAMLMSQNSGIFNEGDGIFTFLSPGVNDIPVLVFLSWRRDEGSEPHGAVGRETSRLANAMFGAERVFGETDGSNFLEQLSLADQVVNRGHMAVILMPEEAFDSTFEPIPTRRSEEAINMQDHFEKVVKEEAQIARLKGTFTDTNPFPTDRIFDRFEAAKIVVERYRKAYKNVRFVVSNGFNSRTLLAIYEDDPDFLYLPGYMGGAAAVGEGLALTRKDIHIVVLDGNENRQMSPMYNHLKSEYPQNLDIVTFDDRAASSVGGSKSRDLTSDEYNFSRVIQTESSNYPGFVSTAARVQNSPQHTREFVERLKEVPVLTPNLSEELYAENVIKSGKLPQP